MKKLFIFLAFILVGLISFGQSLIHNIVQFDSIIELHSGQGVTVDDCVIKDGSAADSDSLGSQSPAYYLDRTNHTGAQAITTITGLQDSIDRHTDTLQVHNTRLINLENASSSGGGADSSRSVLVKRSYGQLDTVFYGTAAQRGLDAMDIAITWAVSDGGTKYKFVTYADSLTQGVDWCLADNQKEAEFHIFGTVVTGSTVFTLSGITATEDKSTRLYGNAKFNLTGELWDYNSPSGSTKATNDYLEFAEVNSSGSYGIYDYGRRSGSLTIANGCVNSTATTAIYTYINVGGGYYVFDNCNASSTVGIGVFMRGDNRGSIQRVESASYAIHSETGVKSVNVNYAYSSTSYALYCEHTSTKQSFTFNYAYGGFNCRAGIAYNVDYGLDVIANQLDNCEIYMTGSATEYSTFNLKAQRIEDLYLTHANNNSAGFLNIDAKQITLKQADNSLLGNAAAAHLLTVIIDFEKMYAYADYSISDLDNDYSLKLKNGTIFLTGAVTTVFPQITLGISVVYNPRLELDNVTVIDNTTYSSGTKNPFIEYNDLRATVTLKNCDINIVNGGGIVDVENDGVLILQGQNKLVSDTNYYAINVEAGDTLTCYNTGQLYMNTYLPATVDQAINLNTTGFIDYKISASPSWIEDKELFNLLNK